MRNPAVVNGHKLNSPVNGGKSKKSNQPYLRFRRRMRKNMFGKAL